MAGIYSALTSFSGVDLLKGSPQAIVANLMGQILNQKSSSTGSVNGAAQEDSTTPPKKAKLSFKFTLIADSHNDNDYLKKALTQAKKDSDVKLVIGLGDYTEIGTQDELSQAKKEFDLSGLRYFLTAGDHDLWDARDKQRPATDNFTNFFGSPYQSFSYDNVRFIILYNGDNYLGFGKEQLDFLSGELARIKGEETKLILAFMHEPLYHPSSTRVMGKANPKLKEEARGMVRTLKESRVAEIFAGDVHYFGRYEDSETSLKMTTIGAITSLRNTQNPRYGVVSVYDDGSYVVDDIEIR